MSNHIPNNILAAGLLLTSTVFLAEFAVAEPTPYTQNSKLFPRKAGWFKLDSTIPAHMEDAAPTDTSIYIFFTTAVATDTNADTFQLKRMDTGKVVATDNGIHGATVILTPEQKLEYGTEYYVENNGVVRSSLGKRLKDRVFVRFSTDNIFIPIADPTYSPADGEGIAPSGEIYRPVTEERAALHAARRLGQYPPSSF
ncbi:MAG: Ig-like domain-containing protein [Exilibacterium sp.]